MIEQPDEAPEAIAIDIESRMGVIEVADCIELITSTPVGRVGFLSEGAPLVLPVNFAWFEDTIVFRTLEGKKLAAAAEGQTVCFEVDAWNAHDHSGWSVVVTGGAREVTGWAEAEQLENIGLVSWAHEKWRPIWVRIDPTNISGRLLR